MSEMLVNDLIFIDESGASLRMAREYARTAGGERIKMLVPASHGPKLSIISAISAQEVVTTMYGEWSTDGEIFSTFIEKCLVPKLSAGKIVLLDNVAFHNTSRIQTAIESVGAKIKFLPAYSPDFSPIENMWSKIKTVLRKFSPRTLKEFKKAIKEAFASISTTDLLSWFRHCGYNI